MDSKELTRKLVEDLRGKGFLAHEIKQILQVIKNNNLKFVDKEAELPSEIKFGGRIISRNPSIEIFIDKLGYHKTYPIEGGAE